MMDRTKMKILVMFNLVAAVLPSVCSAQAGGPAISVKNLGVTPEYYVTYPSLRPLIAVTVGLATPPEMVGPGGLMSRAVGAGWDCTKPSSYKIAVVSSQGGGPLKEVGTEAITAVVLEGNDPTTGKRYTACDGKGTVGAVNLIFNYTAVANEYIQVSLVGLPAGLTAQSDGKAQLKKSLVTFSATPQAAPKEKLTNGKNRDTGQLSVSFADSTLFPGSQLPFDTYVKSTDLFSTDEKDAKSAFAGTVGVQRGIFPTWYAPLHFDETIQGNQTATNLSAVTTLGITTLLPWRWSDPLFYNSAFKAPLPPDITINNQYTNRINQLVMKNSKLLATNDYSLNPVMSWSSMSFPWACSLFSVLKVTSKGDNAKSGNATVKPDGTVNQGVQYCLGAAIDLGMYYLPLDLTKAGHQQVQGYGDVSILIPLSGLSFAQKIFPYLTSNDPTKSQIRIKYSDTVDPANNYARSKGWTYGIELIK
jgi:hypothetical protein